MRILIIGDVVGRSGRLAIRELLPEIQEKYRLDLILANGEKAAGGIGITIETAEELFDYGVDVLTMGNHVWDKKEAIQLIDEEERIFRPANYPAGAPGRGYGVYRASNGIKIGIINLSGRVFLTPLDCPFVLAEKLVGELKKETAIIIVDFHAEATSEKVAFGWFLDGKASVVFGTHTHIQTADSRILPHGTAYITDVGMTGPRDSVLGIKIKTVINKFITQMPARFEVAAGQMQLNGIVAEVNPVTGKAVMIERIQYYSYD